VPVQGLNLQWTGAYTDAKLTSDAPGVAGSGSELPYAPKWSTTLDGEYVFPLFSNYKSFVGATWSFIGNRTTDFGSAATPSGQLDLPSYNTTALRVGVERDLYRVWLYAKNLGDARGITDYAASPGAPYNEVTVIQPRTIGVVLSAKF
jgi:hypothetical protein